MPFQNHQDPRNPPLPSLSSYSTAPSPSISAYPSAPRRADPFNLRDLSGRQAHTPPIVYPQPNNARDDMLFGRRQSPIDHKVLSHPNPNIPPQRRPSFTPGILRDDGPPKEQSRGLKEGYDYSNSLQRMNTPSSSSPLYGRRFPPDIEQTRRRSLSGTSPQRSYSSNGPSEMPQQPLPYNSNRQMLPPSSPRQYQSTHSSSSYGARISQPPPPPPPYSTPRDLPSLSSIHRPGSSMSTSSMPISSMLGSEPERPPRESIPTLPQRPASKNGPAPTPSPPISSNLSPYMSWRSGSTEHPGLKRAHTPERPYVTESQPQKHFPTFSRESPSSSLPRDIPRSSDTLHNTRSPHMQSPFPYSTPRTSNPPIDHPMEHPSLFPRSTPATPSQRPSSQPSGNTTSVRPSTTSAWQRPASLSEVMNNPTDGFASVHTRPNFVVDHDPQSRPINGEIQRDSFGDQGQERNHKFSPTSGIFQRNLQPKRDSADSAKTEVNHMAQEPSAGAKSPPLQQRTISHASGNTFNNQPTPSISPFGFGPPAIGNHPFGRPSLSTGQQPSTQVTPGPTDNKTNGSSGSEHSQSGSAPPRKEVDDSHQTQHHRALLGIVSESQRGRVSPLPQAVQGAQGPTHGPTPEPGIKSEFGRMFIGLGTGVGSTMVTAGPISSGTQGTPPTSAAKGEDSDHRQLGLDSRAFEAQTSRSNSRAGRQNAKRKDDDDKFGNESTDGRSTPAGSVRGGRRSRYAPHHHHHYTHQYVLTAMDPSNAAANTASHHHHHHHPTEDGLSAGSPLQPLNQAGAIGRVSTPADLASNSTTAAMLLRQRHHHHHHHVPIGAGTAMGPTFPKAGTIIDLRPLLASVAALPRYHLGSTLYQPRLELPTGDTASKFNLVTTPLPLPCYKDRANCTFTVRVPRSYLSRDHREAVCSRRAVWGTSVYTDDSDPLAAAIHSGWVRGEWGEDIDISLLDLGDGENKAASEQRSLDAPPVAGPIQPPAGKDLHLTLLVLPPLEKYDSSTAFGLKSRTWGNNHDGMSFKIEKMMWVDEGAGRNEERGGESRRKRLRALFSTSQFTGPGFTLMGAPKNGQVLQKETAVA
ncbi:MAG: hypothetical protein M1834_003204 [Cirrosporium novae-zelandiae]|nr:MAG: hypothetical protein M1834_003204 [Cirrosporium novae-zelandiae]